MIKLNEETIKQITVALKVSLSVSVVVAVSMVMFGTGTRYTLMDIAGLFPAMLLLQFAGILLGIVGVSPGETEIKPEILQ